MIMRAIFKQTRSIRPIRLPLVRPFSSSLLKLQESPKSNSQDEPKSDEPKRRPLSRVAIGGSKESMKQFNKGSGLEFATWKAVVVLLVFGGIGTYFFQQEKARLQRHKEMEQNRKVGTPLIGGPFNLIDTNGNPFTEKNLVDPKGKKFSIL